MRSPTHGFPGFLAQRLLRRDAADLADLRCQTRGRFHQPFAAWLFCWMVFGLPGQLLLTPRLPAQEPSGDALADPSPGVASQAKPEVPDHPTELPTLDAAEQAIADAMPDAGTALPEWKRLQRDADAWIDPKQKWIIIDGEICLRRGPLEMFACPKKTKEHEAIVAVNSKMLPIHAALLQLGAKKGKPVSFKPSYQPPTGEEMEIRIFWREPDGTAYIAQAQDWIQDSQTEATMQQPFVFCGSQIWVEESTGAKSYLAEAGDFICVANFPSAMMDVPIQSSQDSAGLIFQANPARIPRVGTKVRLVLRKKVDAEAEAKAAEPNPGEAKLAQPDSKPAPATPKAN